MNVEPKRGQPGYKSQWKGGRSSNRKGKPRESLEVRFWKKVQLPDDRSQCWLWTGNKNNHGYGQIWSMEPGDPAQITAHRASLRIHGISVPDGLVVDHVCKNKGCVNPAHLRFVTQLENCTTLANPNPFTVNMAKTTCIRGHPFDITMKRRGKEHRACSICVKIRADRAKERKLAKQQSKPNCDHPVVQQTITDVRELRIDTETRCTECGELLKTPPSAGTENG